MIGRFSFWKVKLNIFFVISINISLKLYFQIIIKIAWEDLNIYAFSKESHMFLHLSYKLWTSQFDLNLIK